MAMSLDKIVEFYILKGSFNSLIFNKFINELI